MNPVALITGAALRIGAVLTEQLHQAGYNLVIHYRHSESAAKALAQRLNQHREGSAILLAADLADHQQVLGLADKALNHWGRMDLLVNNASSFYATPVGQIEDADWHNLISSNLKAPLFLSQALTPALRQQKGCIINLIDSSIRKPKLHYSLYTAAKAGLEALTLALAKELGPEIRVNGIAPGTILWPSDGSTSSVAGLSAAQQDMLEQTALKRRGEPQDIGKALLFLVREAPYISGQIITVDGGKSLF